jgi:multidrug efflux pump subunit AcrA (membrane-fusion protein)
VAVLLLALAGVVFAWSCGKSAAENPAAAPAIPVQVQIAAAVKIPETTEYLSLL